MKRRIAVFANAWSEKNLSDALEGVKKGAIENNYDLFTFVGFAAPGMAEDEQREEKRIYKLPDLAEFDGAIVFSSTMNFTELVEDIRDRAVAAKVPLVSVGVKIDGAAYVGMNTLESMSELVEHLVTEHNIKDACFVAGPEDNENSIQRLLATKQVFEKHSIDFSEENIRYTDWSARGAMTAVAELLEARKDNLPEVIICANDNLAMAACAEIEKLSLRIPEDIKVTGFDNIYDGQVFYPSLCTVGQDDYEIGYASINSLMRLINDETIDDIIIQNQFIKNQSCGCENHNVDMLRIEECKKRFYDKIKTLEFGWSNNWISQAALSSTKMHEIKENLTAYLKRSKIFGNGTTYIIADEKAKLYLDGKSDAKHSIGYSDDLEIMVAVEKRSIIPCDKIKRTEMIPGYKKIDNDTKLYIFMPVHFQDWVFGYVVVEDWLEGIATGKMKFFVDNFDQTIDKLKLNMSLEYLNDKLTDLYMKDSLTEMYNRFGFDSEGGRIFDDCKEKNEHMILMFIDINRMKLINDYYGHLQGDVAIKTVAEAIKRNIKEDWIAIRFGGDEFLIIGKCDDEEDAKVVKQRISEDVKKSGKEMQLPFYLSASCGYMYFVPEKDKTLDGYVKQADENMYDIKAQIHMADMELRKFEELCKSNPIHK